MTRILALDVATTTGWAIHDTEKTPSAIISGSFRTGGEETSITDKLFEIRRRVPRLIKDHGVEFAAVEEPLAIVPRYKNKAKKDLVESGQTERPSIDGDKVMSLFRKGMNIHQMAAQFRCSIADVLAAMQPGGMNPKTTVMLSELAGGATVAVQGCNVPCVQVRPQTWQATIPASIKSQFSGEGATKKRAKAYCQMLKIVSPNMDSRDACVIALWAAGHCQELKLLERAKEAD